MEKKCKICGKPAVTPETEFLFFSKNSKEDEEATIMRKEGVCFFCAYWIRQHRQDMSGRTFAIVNGSHYVLCERSSLFNGFDGKKYTIRFKDGKVVECNNLWSQGEIPEQFRKDMPDNAEFV